MKSFEQFLKTSRLNEAKLVLTYYRMLDIVDEVEPTLYKVFDMYAKELEQDENLNTWDMGDIENVLNKVGTEDDYKIDKKIENLKAAFSKRLK